MLSHVGPLVFAVSAIPCLFLLVGGDGLEENRWEEGPTFLFEGGDKDKVVPFPPWNKPGSFILNNLEGIKEEVLCSPPQTNLVNQLAAENPICYHESHFETSNIADYSKGIESCW